MNEQERELDLLVAELEQENRLLRARNERLEREALAAPAQDEAQQKANADHAIQCATEAIADADGPIKAVREYYGATPPEAQPAQNRHVSYVCPRCHWSLEKHPAPDLQAELDATNRQVEILSDALAESRREIAALAAPVQEDWGPGPHEVHSLPPAQTAPVQEPVPVFELQKTGWEIICDPDWIQTLPFGTKLYTTPPAAQPANQCTRSHPHENMDAMCELRTEIARLTNENARLKAQPAPVPEPVAWMMKWPNHSPSFTTDKSDYVSWFAGRASYPDELAPLYTTPPAQAVDFALGGEQFP